MADQNKDIEQRIASAISTEALTLIRLIEDSGYEAYFVGGFVRDAIMSRECNDIDLATNAHWSEIERIATRAGYKAYRSGVKHGTITVVVPADSGKGAVDAGGRSFQVTTYRRDGSYTDARHPDNVQFMDNIDEDLSRRDFTINAIAYSTHRGLYDPYGGIADIDRRLIRTVGDAERRFSEDALRILRAVRFSSQLGFKIDTSNLVTMTEKKSMLTKVSIERIVHELDGILLGPFVCDAIMECIDVISFVLPELVAMKGCEQNTPYHIYDVLEHTANVVGHMPATLLGRWAALCHDMGKPASRFFAPSGRGHFYRHPYVSAQIARGLLHRMLKPRLFIDDVVTLVSVHDIKPDPTKQSILKMISRLKGRRDLFEVLCDLQRSDALSQSSKSLPKLEKVDAVCELYSGMDFEKEVFSRAQLSIDGNDLIRAGFKKGPAIGHALDACLEAVIDEKIANSREELLEYAKRI